MRSTSLDLPTQESAYQREMAERLHVPFRILSDSDLVLTRALKLPSMDRGGADAHQAARAGYRRRHHHARVLSGVSAGSECR